MSRHAAWVVLVLVPLLAGHAVANGAWGPNGLALASGPAKQRGPNCWPDGQGGLLVTWAEHREGALHDILLQRLTREGRPAAGWPESGVRRAGVWGYDNPGYLDWDTGAMAAPAGDGGIFLAWRDRRFVAADAPVLQGDLFLVRLDDSGSVAAGWPTDGIPLSVEQSYESDLALLPDGGGGVFVAWSDWTYFSEVRLDHVLADATRPWGWAVNGIRVTRSARPYQQDMPVMALDGQGGVFVGWRAPTSDRAFGLNHVLANGSTDPVWPDVGIALGEGDCQDLRLAPGPGSDVYAAWTVVPPSGPTFLPWPIRAIRLGPQGTARPGWPNQGMIAASSSFGSHDLSAIPDGAGGLFLVWPNYEDPGVEVRVERLDPAGRFLFPTANVPASQVESAATYVKAIADGAGGVVAAWSTRVSWGQPGFDVYARHVSSAGELSQASTPHGNEVILAAGSQVDVKIASDGAGGVFAVWTEVDVFDPAPGGDIYAQWLPATTIPVPPPSSSFLSPAAPNPTSGITSVLLVLPQAAPVEAAVFDVRGTRVRVLAREVMPAGPRSLVWDGRDERGRAMASGIYFIDVVAGNERMRRRVALVH